jgi:hypothetical protein
MHQISEYDIGGIRTHCVQLLEMSRSCQTKEDVNVLYQKLAELCKKREHPIDHRFLHLSAFEELDLIKKKCYNYNGGGSPLREHFAEKEAFFSLEEIKDICNNVGKMHIPIEEKEYSWKGRYIDLFYEFFMLRCGGQSWSDSPCWTRTCSEIEDIWQDIVDEAE